MLKKGDTVRVRLAGTSDEWCECQVILVSENGGAIILAAGSLVPDGHGGFINGLPLTADYSKGTLTSLFGAEYELEKKTG